MMITFHITWMIGICKIAARLGSVLLIMLTLVLTITRPASSQTQTTEYLDVNALHQYFERHMQESTFVAYGGELRFNITDDLLRDLRNELAQIDSANPEEVDRAINRTITEYERA